MTEAEIRTDPDFARRQPLHQQPPDEVLGRHLRHAGVETQQAHDVHAQRAQALELAARQQQARRRFIAGEELARQRLEAQRHRGHAGGTRALAHAADQRLMPQMEAVEGADANHAALWAK
jgi:hypothetical protein